MSVLAMLTFACGSKSGLKPSATVDGAVGGGAGGSQGTGGVVATGVLVSAIGVLSSLDVLRNKPLLTLRSE